MVGDPFEPELAGVAAGVVESVALTAVDELTAVGVIRGTEVPRRFRFRHPLVRRAVYDCAPAGWLLAAHERSAAALAGRGASATERAHHVERSGRRGDARAVAVLREAGQEAAHRAPESAARWYARCTAAAPRRCPRGGPRRASPGARGRARDLRPLHREPCRPPRELPARPRRRRRPADPAHHRVRQDRASPRPPRGGPPTPDRRARSISTTPPHHEAVALMLELAIDGVYTHAVPARSHNSQSRPSKPPRPLGDPAADRHRRPPRWHGARHCAGSSPRRRSTAPRRPPWSTISRTATWRETGLRRPPRRRRAPPGAVRGRRRPRGARDRRGQGHRPARLHPPRFHGPGVGPDAARRARRLRRSPRRGHRGVPTAPQRPEPGRNELHALTHRPGGRRPGARRQHGAGVGRPDPERGCRALSRRRTPGPVRGASRVRRPRPGRRRRPHGPRVRRARAAVDAGRQLPRQVARAAHPMLDRARTSSRRRTSRCRRSGH